MPYFNSEEHFETIEITPAEFLHECDPDEINEIVKILTSQGEVNPVSPIRKQIYFINYDDALKMLEGKSYMLTLEEENYIKKLAERVTGDGELKR